jgi:hypothetical protein
MNQNTTVDNDLQKAIDDITKSTSGDPLFADPVAAPAPAPAPAKAAPAPAPRPVAKAAPRPAPAPMPAPKPVAPAEPVSAPQEDLAPVEIGHEEDMEPVAPFLEGAGMGIGQVKEAALRELAPILDKLDVPSEQKFDIYKNVIDNYHDSSVVEPAYRAALGIADERERGEALLYIIDSIDNM